MGLEIVIVLSALAAYVGAPVAAALLPGLWNKRASKPFEESARRLGLVPDGFVARGASSGFDVELGIVTRGLAGKRAQAFTEARVHLQPPLDLGLRVSLWDPARTSSAVADDPGRAEALQPAYGRIIGPQGAIVRIDDEAVTVERYGAVIEPGYLAAMLHAGCHAAGLLESLRPSLRPRDGAIVQQFQRAAYSQGLEPTVVPAGMKGDFEGLPVFVWRTATGHDVARVRVPADLYRALRLVPREEAGSRPFEVGVRDIGFRDPRLDGRLIVLSDDAKRARAAVGPVLRDRLAAALEAGGVKLTALGLELRALASDPPASTVALLQTAMAIARELVDAFELRGEQRGPYR